MFVYGELVQRFVKVNKIREKRLNYFNVYVELIQPELKIIKNDVIGPVYCVVCICFSVCIYSIECSLSWWDALIIILNTIFGWQPRWGSGCKWLSFYN